LNYAEVGVDRRQLVRLGRSTLANSDCIAKMNVLPGGEPAVAHQRGLMTIDPPQISNTAYQSGRFSTLVTPGPSARES
jgi:hypothetical protein